MDFSLLLFGLFALIYLGMLLYFANMQELARVQAAAKPLSADQDKSRYQTETLLRWMLYGIAGIIFVFGLLILQVAVVPLPDTGTNVNLPQVELVPALVYFAISTLAAFVSVRLVASPNLRGRIKRLTGAGSSYLPESYLHLTAMVLALAFVAIIIGQAVLSGGITGLAQDIQSEDIVAPGQMAFQAALFIVIALLGVGAALRRTLPETFKRLGLRLPTWSDITWGIGVGILLYGVQVALVLLWYTISSAEIIAEQSAASDQFASLFNTLPLAFALSLSSAVSEEILFRGALQPVFGLRLTSLFFALVHIQYTFTPITLIIFVVALGLGWLRQRQSTTASIVAHFTYNFVQLALALLASGL
ncbi:MAG: CPBP family intramembrane metalloprotease [Anaerolineaceae bacterium]|nr:CPBP family intramembrane metalloprotease [Anaerolineaceae bacterium]